MSEVISMITITYSHVAKLFNSFIDNVRLNNRFYSIKMIIDLLSETELLRAKWTDVKHNNIILMLLIGSVLPEMLTSHETSPKNYRSFLAKYYSIRRDNKQLVDTKYSFCSQSHRYANTNLIDSDNSTDANTSDESISTDTDLVENSCRDTRDNIPQNKLKECNGSIVDCFKFNILLFRKNILTFCKLYSKLYLLGYILPLAKTQDIYGILSKYITDVLRSSLAMSLVYLIMHTYLTLIDRLCNPKKIHYNLGLVISTIPLILLEKKNRLGNICQFMMAIYANMFMYYSTPKIDNLWEIILYVTTFISIEKRGFNRTLLSLV